jgi:fatty-acyl-CoA synthase
MTSETGAAHPLDSLFSPRSIAVIGASREAAKIPGLLLAFLRRNGFAGKIFPVNPRYDDIEGLRCYPSIAAVGRAVDLAVLVVPARFVLEQLEACAAAGVRNALVISSGFAEGGGSHDAQHAMAALARRSGMRICGPNAEGFYNEPGKIAATFSPTVDVKADAPRLVATRKRVGIVAQSGGIGFALYQRARAMGVAVSHVISTGNEADVACGEVFGYLAQDATTDVILMFIEGVRDGAAFRSAARAAASAGKPVVVCKAGRTLVGQRAAASHTASMAGWSAAYDAVFAADGLISAADIDEAVAIAATFAANPLPRGDRVAVLALNTTDTLEVQFACGRLGAAFVPLNTRLAIPELEFIVGDASPMVLIHDDELATVAAAVASACRTPNLLRFGPAGSYEHAIAEAPLLDTPEIVSHDSMSTIMYTSGTTGRPKGAIITHGMTFWNCVNLGGPAYITPSSVLLTVLPLFHTGGLNCYTNPVLHAGGTVLIMRSFDPGTALELISDPARGINIFFGVPSIYQFMAQHPSFAAADFSRLIIGGVGGAPMPVPLLKIWEDRGVALQQGYGMTETSPAVLALDREDAARKAGSAGKPVLHTEVRIVRPDGSDAAPGELGELWVKGPNITPGYWNRPEANASSFTDGWLHTGDAARVDEDGFYYIVDRWKDMYISGGENVYPAEVENVLYQIPAVAEAAVIGAPDERWGEVGVAIVAVKPGMPLTEAEVRSHCAANLARFKCPGVIHFIEALPRNATGKVHKPTLRERFTRPRAIDGVTARAS